MMVAGGRNVQTQANGNAWLASHHQITLRPGLAVVAYLCERYLILTSKVKAKSVIFLSKNGRAQLCLKYQHDRDCNHAAHLIYVSCESSLSALDSTTMNQCAATRTWPSPAGGQVECLSQAPMRKLFLCHAPEYTLSPARLCKMGLFPSGSVLSRESDYHPSSKA